MTKNMICAERLYLTKDRMKLVGHGDKAAAFLYATPGDEIPESAVERFKLKDGGVSGPKAGQKEKAPPPNKEKKGGEDKGGGKPADKDKSAPQKPAALTDISGIGPATAKALVAAGIADVAALSQIDPASPPAIDKLPPAFDWAAIVGAAGVLALAAVA
ncbi:helix-hairpin-helix domain-containing protein [Allopontixanthobacter sp.]|uniref:helix-hairpin-helix domain-containing protein n=1 Tax=Allopontixanthobacter sp. TaxID=2906452 RepID=UPI002ABCF164|nr:helix-hairpin-helix domain-containing protein [Allopontixanthobacter sp.]MDZ4307555.1 helix-hairpin-helix domain-containing protein [Allopontixanthobacter sp.]